MRITDMITQDEFLQWYVFDIGKSRVKNVQNIGKYLRLLSRTSTNIPSQLETNAHSSVAEIW